MNIGPSLMLRPITAVESGEMVRPFPLPADRPCLIGRSSEADWPVQDSSLSRRHATIERKADNWFLTDLSSRHGTSINNRRLEPGVPVPIQDGDVIAFGGWRCRCTSGSARPGVTTSIAPGLDMAASVSAIPAQQLGGVAQRGLDVLMELTTRIGSAGSREAVAQAAAEAVRSATGCRRVVLVEPESDQDLVILASTTKDSPRISRSLIEQASRHGLVQLTVTAGHSDHAQSIMDLGIRSAICAPIMIDGSPTAFMMIDTRDTEGVVPADAASFCQSVATLTGLAFQRINAASMAERHRQLQSDLDAARRAQELLSPPKSGRFGAVSYRFESIPGRIVAGDLFDIFPIGERRTAFFLGDVCGKGVGAAMLMAACQSLLRTHLLSGTDLASAMTAVNADLHARTDASKFITLMAGIVDVEAGDVEIVDAGHGMCILIMPGEHPTRVELPGGLPVGVVASTAYDSSRLDMPAGTRLILFSDGAIEQTDPSGRQYGLDRVLGSLRAASGVSICTARLVDDLKHYAQGPFADDLTVAELSADIADDHAGVVDRDH